MNCKKFLYFKTGLNLVAMMVAVSSCVSWNHQARRENVAKISSKELFLKFSQINSFQYELWANGRYLKKMSFLLKRSNSPTYIFRSDWQIEDEPYSFVANRDLKLRYKVFHAKKTVCKLGFESVGSKNHVEDLHFLAMYNEKSSVIHWGESSGRKCLWLQNSKNWKVCVSPETGIPMEILYSGGEVFQYRNIQVDLKEDFFFYQDSSELTNVDCIDDGV